jgi:hypothetical protein
MVCLYDILPYRPRPTSPRPRPRRPRPTSPPRYAPVHAAWRCDDEGGGLLTLPNSASQCTNVLGANQPATLDSNHHRPPRSTPRRRPRPALRRPPASPPPPRQPTPRPALLRCVPITLMAESRCSGALHAEAPCLFVQSPTAAPTDEPTAAPTFEPTAVSAAPPLSASQTPHTQVGILQVHVSH